MIRKLTLFSLLIWLAASEPVLARTLCVSQDVPLSQSGCAELFTVIQDAITAAEDGDTVKIFPGVWEQNIFVTKKIAVIGTNFPATVIHPPSGQGVLIMNNGFVSCLKIKSETNLGVVIFQGAVKNCIIEGCGNQNDMYCSGVRYMSNSALVANCLIRNGYHGIYGDGDSLVKVTAVNNIFLSNKGYAGYSYNNATAKVNFNCYYKNGADGWAWNGGDFFLYSNLIADPLLGNNYLPLPNSPLLNRGDTAIFNPDGSRSDIGVYGGPDSCLCSVPVGVEDNQAPKLKITITPNPASEMAVINYQLPSDGSITITVSNWLGQIVITPLKNHWQTAGSQQLNFSLTELPSGSYVLSIKTGRAIMTNKFIVIK